MKMDLVLAFSSKVYLVLEKDKDLQEIDSITTNYEDMDSLINSEHYKNEVDDFYFRYQKYRDKIQNVKDINGHLLIIPENDTYNNLDVVYKKYKTKKNGRRLIGAINRTLKETKRIDIILDIYRKCDFFLGSNYNYRSRGLGKAKRILYTSSYINDSNAKYYNKLVNILNTELLKGYNKETKELDDRNYIYARIVDTVIKKHNIDTMKPKIQVVKENIEKAGSTVIRKDLSKYKGQGVKAVVFDLYYGEEEEYNSDQYEEDDNILEIDDFSFEEKDDEDTWFK